MRSLSVDSDSATHSAFIESLSSFSRLHRAQRWEGTFGEFLATVLPPNPAAAAGSDVGRRLLLLLGPPSGGKSTLAILLKRGLEEYSRTDEGAIYAIKGSPMRENPLNLIPTSLRAEFRERYGVHIQGELSPW